MNDFLVAIEDQFLLWVAAAFRREQMNSVSRISRVAVQ